MERKTSAGKAAKETKESKDSSSSVLVRSAGRLKGKNAVITGAGSGIGRASAILFAEQGCNVFCVDWNEDGVKETVALIAKAAPRVKAVAHKADCGDERANAQIVAQCVERFGGLDIFFANAGVIGPNVSILENEPQDMADTFRVNVIGVAMGIKHAAKQMMKQGRGGSILCTSSVAGIRASAGREHSLLSC
jgi:NAD(P)-dependent dehydrogenase (short-subunit alcohol dehydrogenase family)